MFNKFMKKTVEICLSVVLVLTFMMSNVYADEPAISYSAEYTETTLTITFYISEIEAFDLAAIYDPALLTVTDMGYTTEFKQLQSQGYSTLSVQNEDAVDENGNTYAVFVGAGFTSGNEPIPYEGQPLGTITFEGNVADAKVIIISNSADEENVMYSDIVGMSTYTERTGNAVEVTPSNDQKTDSAATNNATGDNSNSDTSDSNSTVTDGSLDTSKSSDGESKDSSAGGEDTENSADNSSDIEATDGVEATEEADDKENDKENDKDKKSGNVVIYVILSIVVVLIAVIAILLVLKKKKLLNKN